MNKACQTIYNAKNEMIFSGEWDPKILYQTISQGNDELWVGKRVLDIGANTCGLSIEIARRGGIVTSLEPDPYNNTIGLSRVLINSLTKEENLNLTIIDKGLFDADQYRGYDIVLCLGLLYHFRYPQYILDYLSTLEMEILFLGTQVHPGESLCLMNRRDKSVLKPGLLPDETVLSGWHPTRPLLERMLEWAGFVDIVSLTDSDYVFPNKQKGLTNSAYYRCRRTKTVNPQNEMTQFYPR
jgi:SAM-dependent methyltransferase